MSLNVTVVGAGIAGLCAAMSLRQAGHHVKYILRRVSKFSQVLIKIFEKSSFASEIGAALALTPNGILVLQKIGFSLERARAVLNTARDTIEGSTLRRLASMETPDGFWTVHRVDLHDELLRLATTDDGGEGRGEPVELRLGCPVVCVDPDGGVVMLQDGSRHVADLVVGADGLHSVVRGAVLDAPFEAPVHSGLAAFRSLVDTSVVKTYPALAAFVEAQGGRSVMLIDGLEGAGKRHIMWYTCRGGEVQNIVGILPSQQQHIYEGEDAKSQMRNGFEDFHEDIIQLIDMLSNVKIWPLLHHAPYPRWVRGKAVLIGDAAHPMLPFSGQGANQAMEDGAALGVLLKEVSEPAVVKERLSLYERLRKNRVARVQTMSKVRRGREEEIQEELRQYADSPGGVVPTTYQERVVHDCSFDVYSACERALHANGYASAESETWSIYQSVDFPSIHYAKIRDKAKVESFNLALNDMLGCDGHLGQMKFPMSGARRFGAERRHRYELHLIHHEHTAFYKHLSELLHGESNHLTPRSSL